MKKLSIFLLAMVLITGFGGIIMAADISGSKHDFSPSGSGQGAGLNSGGICNTCHGAHSPAEAGSGPLWGHEVTAQTFTPYADPGGTIDAGDLSATMGGVSKLCLSCHDGSVAIDAFGGGAGTVSITGTADVTNDLSDDHPISFTYDGALATADGELTIPISLNEVTVGGLPLFEGTGKMECATCHNVHDGAATMFLRVANTNSDLCTTCHNK